jgi:hypothetical protein
MARQPQHAHARAPDLRRRRSRGYDYRVLLTGLESSVPIKPSTLGDDAHRLRWSRVRVQQVTTQGIVRLN